MKLKFLAIAFVFFMLVFGCVKAKDKGSASSNDAQSSIASSSENGSESASEGGNSVEGNIAQGEEQSGAQTGEGTAEQPPEDIAENVVAQQGATCTSSNSFTFVSASMEGKNLVAKFRNNYGVMLFSPSCNIEGTTGDRCGADIASIAPYQEVNFTVTDAPDSFDMRIKAHNSAKVVLIESVSCRKLK